MMGEIKIIKKEDYDKFFQKPNQKFVWNNIAFCWKDYRNKPLEVVKDFLKNKSGLVIDFGCGSCRNMIFNKNIEYYGVDFSENQIKNGLEYVRTKKINAHLFVSRLDKLDKNIFKNEMFDYGLFIGSLHCLETEKERKKALKEFFRILKKNSEALISVWNSEDKRFDKVSNKGDIYMSWKKDGKDYMRYYYLFSKKELIDLLKNVGFKILNLDFSGEDRFSRKNWIFKIKKL